MIRFAKSETLLSDTGYPSTEWRKGQLVIDSKANRKKKQQLKLPIQFKVKYVTMILLETNTNYHFRLNEYKFI